MNDVDVPGGLPQTLVFRLGTVGAVASDRFAGKLADRGLRPKHVGLMNALSRGAAASQQELAALLGVAPSLVVALADQLEELGALARTRDPQDRRRQVLSLTGHGRALLRDCLAQARALDEELAAPLTPEQRRALHQALGVLAAHTGLPTD
ncbi:MarR family winged helix-turn-helix transcriptional regulator [Streptomyces sp. NPDC002004]